MTCDVCLMAIKQYKTNEYVLPWYCKCELFEHKKKISSKQKLITHLCECPTRVLKTTGRIVVYCDC